MESAHSESKSDPTNETVTFFLYNSIKTAIHSYGHICRPRLFRISAHLHTFVKYIREERTCRIAFIRGQNKSIRDGNEFNYHQSGKPVSRRSIIYIGPRYAKTGPLDFSKDVGLMGKGN